MDMRSVSVSVSNMWVTPQSPHPRDSFTISAVPDVRGWVDSHNGEERRSLWGRIETQVLLGEPVVVHEVVNGWARVSAPWQPTHRDGHGYPGWLPEWHLDTTPPTVEGEPSIVVTALTTSMRLEPDGPVRIADISYATVLPLCDEIRGWRQVRLPGGGKGWLTAEHTDRLPAGLPRSSALLMEGRRLLGTVFMAGTACGLAYDCSGLIHAIYRRLGVRIPRDVDDQGTLGSEVGKDNLEAGDLLYFGRPGNAVDHIALCTGGRHILEASGGTDMHVIEGPMTAHRTEGWQDVRRYRAAW
jgi:hypothetical protein